MEFLDSYFYPLRRQQTSSCTRSKQYKYEVDLSGNFENMEKNTCQTYVFIAYKNKDF